ncbi:unnamed protein product [Darwinula stevensoni]|uniref:ceramide glucosyltransferase n=1 Tax=Darwinula stevensoni TaxID=69355 RepID=A0A7R8X4R4_9CRUS|nr:unnamed protein product [Darwinula stevensoni]CAG0886321.1 unnamed protein product [Darwinula stevensoni]
MPLAARSTNWPGVSIVKPLAGADPNLESNLESFFTLNYPLFEILICVHEDGDPIIESVKRLQKKYPHVECRIFVGGENVGPNPKINNLLPGYRAAKYDIFWITDGGIRITPDTLMDMVHCQTDEVGLVHQVPLVRDDQGFATALEKVFFGTVVARVYLAFAVHGMNCFIGMSALVRRSVFIDIGGIEQFSCYVGDDFYMAEAIISKGYKLAISSQPVWQNSGSKRLSTFLARISRWAQYRYASKPLRFVLEPFLECLFLGLEGAWAARMLFGWNPLLFFSLHVLIWFILDLILIKVVNGGHMPVNMFQFLVCWIFRECTMWYPYLVAVFVPTIKWRTGNYRLGWGGKVKEFTPAMSSAPPSIV